jgi:ABC-type multidrug transport system fused ATPase/permease subunit
MTSCLPIFSLFSNRTLPSVYFIEQNKKNVSSEVSPLMMFKKSPIYYCFYTLPPSLHLSIILLSLILIICAALTIQDRASNLYSYSLIHGLRSSIHWIITFLSDLVLCLLWLLILILIARFVHSSTFNGRFFALTPLFFIVNLPFIYLIAKFFDAPIIGATVIIFILQFAQFLYTFRVLIELFRSYRTVSTIIHILRWLLLIIFPNVNVFTLIVTILRPYGCPYDDSLFNPEDFSHERYPYKKLIHTLILITQFIVYFILLIIIDTWKLPILCRDRNITINTQEEDNDVAEERNRIEKMNNEEKQREALVLDNLTKRYQWGHIPAVNRLTFAVPHRQCFGLLGFNGSGMFLTIERRIEIDDLNKDFFITEDKKNNIR